MGKRTGDHSPTRHGVENYQSALAMKVRMLQGMHHPILDLLYATVDTYEARLPSKSFLDASEFDTVHPDNASRNCFVQVQGATALLKHLRHGRCTDEGLSKAILNGQNWSVVSLKA
jgi:hypothetical protein